MRLEVLAHERQVVPRQHDYVLCGGHGLAGAGQVRSRRVVGPGLVERWRDADQDGVEPAVIMTLELDDLRSTGRGAGEAQRGLDHLRAGHTEADQFGARDQVLDAFGENSFGGMLSGEDLATRERVGDGAHDGFGRMAKDVRAHAERIIHVHVAVDVDEVGGFAAGEHQRYGLTVEAEVAVDTAREGVARRGVVRFGLRIGTPWWCSCDQ